MTDIEVNHFRTILRHNQSESANGFQRRGGLTIETSPDELDRIQSANERDFAIGSMERRASRMREVQNALGRIDEVSFGICASCEEQIHPRRLAAVPWARFCIACQQADDRLQGTEGNVGEMPLSEAD